MPHKNNGVNFGSVNLVSRLTEEQQQAIAVELIRDYDNDVYSRSSWEDKRRKWYRLWACERDNKTTPWAGASNVCVPILLTACNQFSARAYQAAFNAPNQIKVLPVVSNDVARAASVEKYMNWQLLYEMKEYEEEVDKLLVNLPINGTCFKKTYYNFSQKRNISEYVSAMDVVVPYRTKSLGTARRIAHNLWLHYDEMQDRDEQGMYENFDNVTRQAGSSLVGGTALRTTVDEITGEDSVNSLDDPKLVLEIHRRMKMPWDDIREPYIITVDYDSRTILRIVHNKIKIAGQEHVIDHFTDYHFFPNPEGFYSFGFGHFLEDLNEMSNTVFNQIFDSGRLTNSPFGFYGRRAGFRKRKIKLQPGAMIEVDDASQIVFPSMQRVDQVLFMVLNQINDYSERIASNTDLLSGREQRGVKTPTKGGTLAIIEQGLVTFGVLTKRIFRQMIKEFGIMYKLNNIYLPESKQFRVLGSDKKLPFAKIRRRDFDGTLDLLPVGDPLYANRESRINEALTLYQLMLGNPLIGPNPQTGELANPNAVRRLTSDILDAFGNNNKEDLLPEIREPEISADAENALFMQGDTREPVVGENHQQHLQIHNDFIQSSFYKAMPAEYKKLLGAHISKTNLLMSIQTQIEQRQGISGGIPDAGGTLDTGGLV